MHSVLEHASQGDIGTRDLATAVGRSGSGELRFTAVDVLRRDERIGSAIRAGDDISIRMRFSCARKIAKAVISVAIYSSKGTPIFVVRTSDLSYDMRDLSESGEIELAIDRPNLLPGRYLIEICAGDEIHPFRYDHILEAAVLDIEPSDVYGTGKLTGTNWSLIFLNCEWRVTSQEHELIGACLFLSSHKASSFVTGTDVRVDGGFLCQTI